MAWSFSLEKCLTFQDLDCIVLMYYLVFFWHQAYSLSSCSQERWSWMERSAEKTCRPVTPLTVEEKQKSRKPELDMLAHTQWYLREKCPECPYAGMICSVGTHWLRMWAPQPNCLNSNISLNSHLL